MKTKKTDKETKSSKELTKQPGKIRPSEKKKSTPKPTETEVRKKKPLKSKVGEEVIEEKLTDKSVKSVKTPKPKKPKEPTPKKPLKKRPGVEKKAVKSTKPVEKEKITPIVEEVIPTAEEIKQEIPEEKPKIPEPASAIVEPEKPEVKPPQPPVIPTKLPPTVTIEISEYDTIKDLAQKLSVTPAEIMKKTAELGLFVSLNQRLDKTLAEIIASEYNYEIKFIQVGAVPYEEEIITGPAIRTPIVTVMGHVDHGKTTLLDAIRESNIVASEYGGITQHIGAYKIKTPQGEITFLDTPGHEAFTALRARGSKVTDIVVLVVSAVDGVQPQTVESINHARAAKVPIIVAINKIDLPGANPEKIKGELNQYNLSPEEWGGDTLMVEISARNRINIDKLLEAIHLQAELLELRCDPDRPASGVVIESKLDPKRGPVATIIVRNGSLKSGDAFVAGETYGKVKAMFDEHSKMLSVAKPSTPVLILGISSLPNPGDKFYVVKSEREAKEIVENVRQTIKELLKKPQRVYTLEDITKREDKVLKIIIKADVAGSLEAIQEHIERIEHPEFKVQIIHSGVGSISESDINLAKTVEAIVIGFNITADTRVKSLAERFGIEIRIYRVIYELFEDIKKALEGMLAPKLQETTTGKATIKNIFKITKVGNVAGCYVTEGKITRGAKCRLLRDSVIVYDGKIATLRRFKEDVNVVEKGFECGITLENFQDIKENDIIETYSIEKIKRFL